MEKQIQPKNKLNFKIKHLPRLFVNAFKIWNKNEPGRLGAVVAYYAVLSLPSLLVVIINLVGYIWGAELVQGQITGQISSDIGKDAAQSLVEIINNTKSDSHNWVMNVVGIGFLVFGATGVFYQLQISMNDIWDVKIDPNSGFWKVVKDRIVSLGFVMVIAFMLIVSFVASTALSVLSNYLSMLWEPAYVVLAQGFEFSLSTVILGLLFVLIFKFMPDVKVEWKSIWLGGFITGFLFNIGKILLSLYFGEANPASTYGAAGSVVLVLLWVSYSSLILFYGAAFTRAYAEKYALDVKIEDHIVKIEKKEIVVPK